MAIKTVVIGKKASQYMKRRPKFNVVSECRRLAGLTELGEAGIWADLGGGGCLDKIRACNMNITYGRGEFPGSVSRPATFAGMQWGHAGWAM